MVIRVYSQNEARKLLDYGLYEQLFDPTARQSYPHTTTIPAVRTIARGLAEIVRCETVRHLAPRRPCPTDKVYTQYLSALSFFPIPLAAQGHRSDACQRIVFFNQRPPLCRQCSSHEFTAARTFKHQRRERERFDYLEKYFGPDGLIRIKAVVLTFTPTLRNVKASIVLPPLRPHHLPPTGFSVLSVDLAGQISLLNVLPYWPNSDLLKASLGLVAIDPESYRVAPVTANDLQKGPFSRGVVPFTDAVVPRLGNYLLRFGNRVQHHYMSGHPRLRSVSY